MLHHPNQNSSGQSFPHPSAWNRPSLPHCDGTTATQLCRRQVWHKRSFPLGEHKKWWRMAQVKWNFGKKINELNHIEPSFKYHIEPYWTLLNHHSTISYKSLAPCCRQELRRWVEQLAGRSCKQSVVPSDQNTGQMKFIWKLHNHWGIIFNNIVKMYGAL